MSEQDKAAGTPIKTDANGKPILPEGHIAINAEDKPLIREIGRELEIFFLQQAEKRGGKLGTKFVLGAIDYVVLKIQDRSKLIQDLAMKPIEEDITARNVEIKEIAKKAMAELDVIKAETLDDYVASVNKVSALGLSDKVVEPFADVVEPPTNEASLPPTDTNAIADTAEATPSPYTAGPDGATA